MPISRITESRKKFVAELKKSPRTTFAELKKALIDSGEMNLATLYRIVEAFCQEGLVHEMMIAGERVIFPCQCEHTTPQDAITLAFCDNCGSVYDTHTKLTPPYTSSLTYTHMKSCSQCVLK